MGLLLSVLITCVGVLEVVAFYTNFTLGSTYHQYKTDLTDVARNYAWELRRNHLHHLFPDGDPEEEFSRMIESHRSRLASTRSISKFRAIEDDNISIDEDSTYDQISEIDNELPKLELPKYYDIFNDKTNEIVFVSGSLEKEIAEAVKTEVIEELPNDTEPTELPREIKPLKENYELPKEISENLELINRKTEVLFEELPKELYEPKGIYGLPKEIESLKENSQNQDLISRKTEVLFEEQPERIYELPKEIEELPRDAEEPKRNYELPEEIDALKEISQNQDHITRKTEVLFEGQPERIYEPQKEIEELPKEQYEPKGIYELSKEIDALKENSQNQDPITRKTEVLFEEQPERIYELPKEIEELLEIEGEMIQSHNSRETEIEIMELPIEIDELSDEELLLLRRLKEVEEAREIEALRAEIEMLKEIEELLEKEGHTQGQDLERRRTVVEIEELPIEIENEHRKIEVLQEDNVELIEIEGLLDEIKEPIEIPTGTGEPKRIVEVAKGIYELPKKIYELPNDELPIEEQITQNGGLAGRQMEEKVQEPSMEIVDQVVGRQTDEELPVEVDEQIAPPRKAESRKFAPAVDDDDLQFILNQLEDQIVTDEAEFDPKTIQNVEAPSIKKEIPENFGHFGDNPREIIEDFCVQKRFADLTDQKEEGSKIDLATPKLDLSSELKRDIAELDLLDIVSQIEPQGDQECAEITKPVKDPSKLAENHPTERVPSPYPTSLFGFSTDNGITDLKVNEEFLRSLDGVKSPKCDDCRRSFRKKRNSSSSSRSRDGSASSVDGNKSRTELDLKEIEALDALAEKNGDSFEEKSSLEEGLDKGLQESHEEQENQIAEVSSRSKTEENLSQTEPNGVPVPSSEESPSSPEIIPQPVESIPENTDKIPRDEETPTLPEATSEVPGESKEPSSSIPVVELSNGATTIQESVSQGQLSSEEGQSGKNEPKEIQRDVEPAISAETKKAEEGKSSEVQESCPSDPKSSLSVETEEMRSSEASVDPGAAKTEISVEDVKKAQSVHKVDEVVPKSSPKTLAQEANAKVLENRRLFKTASVNSFEDASSSQNNEMNQQQQMATTLSLPNSDAFWVKE